MNTFDTDTDPRAAVRVRILAAAQVEFAAHGLRGASVHAIAEHAGVTAAMINYYFGGKQALYEQVIAEAGAALARRLMEAAAEAPAEELAPQLVGAYFDFLVESGTFQRLLMREVLDRGDEAAKMARGYLLPIRDFLQGRFGSGGDMVQPTLSLVGAVGAWFLYAPVVGDLVGSDPLAPEALAARRRHVVGLARSLHREFAHLNGSADPQTHLEGKTS